MFEVTDSLLVLLKAAPRSGKQWPVICPLSSIAPLFCLTWPRLTSTVQLLVASALTQKINRVNSVDMVNSKQLNNCFAGIVDLSSTIYHKHSRSNYSRPKVQRSCAVITAVINGGYNSSLG